MSIKRLQLATLNFRENFYSLLRPEMILDRGYTNLAYGAFSVQYHNM
jgi:hypothetical protein